MVNFKVIFLLLSLYYCCNIPRRFVHAETLSTGEDVDSFVEHLVDGSDVVIFAKSYCPYCQRTYKMLKNMHKDIPGWTLNYIELDLLPEEDGPLVQMELLQKTGENGVPCTFFQGMSVVGWDNIDALYDSGDLEGILRSMNVDQKQSEERHHIF